MSESITYHQSRLILQDIIKHKAKEDLHKWIRLNLKINIPKERICKDHCAPFDFVADFLFDEFDGAILLANRNGGKTNNFGALIAICNFLYDHIETGYVGSIEDQSKKGYNYYLHFSQQFPFNQNLLSSTIELTKHKNGSQTQVLPGTMNGVNGPHPQITLVDEVDLMSWPILQQALSMPKSKDHFQAKLVLTSTRKFGTGPMQRLIDESEKRRFKVYQYCIWEVIEKLPDKDTALYKEIQSEFGVLPQNIEKSDGYYSWKDTINEHSRLDPETWEVEWLCSKPGTEGLIYGSSYSDEENMIFGDYKPMPQTFLLYLGEDFGYGIGHPDVVLFCEIPRTLDRIIIFDELYMTLLDTEDLWNSTMDKLAEYELRLEDIEGWIPDPHGLTEIADRLRRGAPMLEKVEDAKMYEVLNGIALVKKYLSTGRIMIHERCINLRTEFLSYKKVKNRDGSYGKDPEKKNDHGPSVVRYITIRLDNMLSPQIWNQIRAKKAILEEKIDEVKPREFLEVGGDVPLTYDLLERKL